MGDHEPDSSPEPSRTAPTRAARAWAFLFLLGACLLATQLEVVIHEGGHYVAARIEGYDHPTMVFSPFGNSHVSYGMRRDHSAETTVFKTAAGPLLPVAVGFALAAALWRWRRSAFLPVFLLLPLALVNEGMYFTGDFGDPPLLSSLLQVSPGAFVAAGVASTLLGFALLLGLQPLVGIGKDASFLARFVVLAGGTLSNLAGAFFPQARGHLSLGRALVVGAIGLAVGALVLAVPSRLLARISVRFMPCEVEQPGPVHAVIAVVAGVALTVALGLVG